MMFGMIDKLGTDKGVFLMRGLTECVRYLVVAAVILTPMFIMAHELDGDEFAKSGVGLAMGAVVLAAMKIGEKLWQNRPPPR